MYNSFTRNTLVGTVSQAWVVGHTNCTMTDKNTRIKKSGTEKSEIIKTRQQSVVLNVSKPCIEIFAYDIFVG